MNENENKIREMMDRAYGEIRKLEIGEAGPETRTDLIILCKEIAFTRGMETLPDADKCVIADWVGSKDKGNVKGTAASVINSIENSVTREKIRIDVLGIKIR